METEVKILYMCKFSFHNMMHESNLWYKTFSLLFPPFCSKLYQILNFYKLPWKYCAYFCILIWLFLYIFYPYELKYLRLKNKTILGYILLKLITFLKGLLRLLHKKLQLHKFRSQKWEPRRYNTGQNKTSGA